MIAIIGDIKTSRKIQARNQFQQKLKSLMMQLNRGRRNIVSPYTLTIGDEFQALYKKADGVLSDCIRIISGIYPEKVRIAMGVGKITTAINRKQALGMDGPAFHCAREGIERQKGRKRSPIIVIQGLDESLSYNKLLISSLTMFAGSIESMHKNSLEILIALYSKTPVKKIADQLDLTIQGVYKHIRGNNIANTVAFMENFEQALNERLVNK
ncbi:MAG: hypothetical protein GF401_16755 [Chitinivibrionales bacterium]|nr:hypothetical protein [Chitinivibrionales bacterium]